MSNVATTQNQTEEKKVTTIDVPENLEFDANVKSLFANTIELTKLVDSLFGPAMRDYVGCKISLNVDPRNMPAFVAAEIPMNKFYVTLYFKDRSNTNDKCPIKNVTLRSHQAGKSKLDSLMMMTGANAGRTYNITDETYEALNEFKFFPARNSKSVWANLTSEITSNFGFSGSYNQEAVACITGLDLEKIISKVYGTRTEEGIFQYQAVPVQIVANVNGEYVVQITQLDMSKMDEMRRSLGGPINRTEFHQYIR